MDYEGDCTDLDSNLDEEPLLPPYDDSLVPKVATINLSALTQNATEMRCQKETADAGLGIPAGLHFTLSGARPFGVSAPITGTPK